jgi:hypothetical protein
VVAVRAPNRLVGDIFAEVAIQLVALVIDFLVVDTRVRVEALHGYSVVGVDVGYFDLAEHLVHV